ncbi:ABC transporter substrate-binding protein [Tepidanaerobacter sp. EBM-49]|uniref:ABC transporter substrate-binding protein n=1 Tax=Tepidanaerobacter sp. EBM-49 TaxID=1918504 RepID=UPI000ABF31EB|nr:ABC transporter substrate-binding protein [Tepidanaerobacter sp. EBM-49]
MKAHNLKRIICILIALFICITMVAGCGTGTKESKPETSEATGGAADEKDGGTLTIALSATPKNLDPIDYTGVYEGNVIINVCDTLVKYDKSLQNIIPAIATEWSVSDDMKTYTFKLRDDVYFQKGKYQDGRKMTAEDVKYSLERSAKESAMNRLSMLDHVDVVSDTEIKAVLKAPNAAFLTALTDAGNTIVPKEEVEGWGDQFGLHLVGTGPFKLVDFIKDDSVVLERNEKYWGQKPHLDGVVFKFISDINMMANALRTGEIDVATDLVGESINVIKQSDDLVLEEVPGLVVSYVYMNMMQGPTADRRVREAIISAVDIDEMVKGIYTWGEAQRGYLPLPPGSWGYDPSLESLIPAYNPEKAKQLLTEAGYPNGFETEIHVGNKPARMKMSTIMQNYLKQNLNIDMKIQVSEWGTFSDIASKGKAPLYGMSWTWYPDPYFFLNQMFHSSQIGSLGNGQGFNNPEVDKLLDDAVTTTVDINERAALYKKALKLIVEELPQIDYAHEKVIYGLNKNVQGFVVSPDNQINLVTSEINVWKQK